MKSKEIKRNKPQKNIYLVLLNKYILSLSYEYANRKYPNKNIRNV
jgi:hypothetical protein